MRVNSHRFLLNLSIVARCLDGELIHRSPVKVVCAGAGVAEMVAAIIASPVPGDRPFIFF
jgi:hypothetical protein